MMKLQNKKTALVYAVDLLSKRGYSTQQLITKLKRKEYSAEEIQEAIERLINRHYLDDTDLCQRQYQAYLSEQRRSLKAIKYKLSEKGFSKEDISLAEENLDIDTLDFEYNVCLRLLCSHYNLNTAEKLKCQAYLYRKGFNSSAIRLAIEDFFQK